MSEKKDEEKKSPTLDDIDDFWDLDSLLPQRRPVDPARHVNTDTVELEIGRTTETGGTPIPERTGPVPRRDGAYSKTFSGEPVAASPRDEARRLRELSMKTRAKRNEPVPLEPYLSRSGRLLTGSMSGSVRTPSGFGTGRRRSALRCRFSRIYRSIISSVIRR